MTDTEQAVIAAAERMADWLAGNETLDEHERRLYDSVQNMRKARCARAKSLLDGARAAAMEAEPQYVGVDLASEPSKTVFRTEGCPTFTVEPWCEDYWCVRKDGELQSTHPDERYAMTYAQSLLWSEMAERQAEADAKYADADTHGIKIVTHDDGLTMVKGCIFENVEEIEPQRLEARYIESSGPRPIVYGNVVLDPRPPSDTPGCIDVTPPLCATPSERQSTRQAITDAETKVALATSARRADIRRDLDALHARRLRQPIAKPLKGPRYHKWPGDEG